MKRLTALLLLLSILLCGCANPGQRFKSPVTFYYVLDQYPYGGSEGVMGTEIREAAEHKDLSYLMALYIMGPSGDGLHSPIPQGTRVHFVKKNAGGITVSLSDTADALSDSEFTLACACLSMTLFGISDAQQVTVQCADRTVTMNRESLVLYDSNPLEESK